MLKVEVGKGRNGRYLAASQALSRNSVCSGEGRSQSGVLSGGEGAGGALQNLPVKAACEKLQDQERVLV